MKRAKRARRDPRKIAHTLRAQHTHLIEIKLPVDLNAWAVETAALAGVPVAHLLQVILAFETRRAHQALQMQQAKGK